MLTDSLNRKVHFNFKVFFKELSAHYSLKLSKDDLLYRLFHQDKAINRKRMASIRAVKPNLGPNDLREFEDMYTRGVTDRIVTNPFFWFSDDLKQVPDKKYSINLKRGPYLNFATF
mgnify:FL=1